jgi:hypothetical protein
MGTDTFECGRCGARYVTQACSDIHARECTGLLHREIAATNAQIDAARRFDTGGNARQPQEFVGPRQGSKGEHIPGADHGLASGAFTGPVGTLFKDMAGNIGIASGRVERTFTRAEVLAVLRAQHALALDETATGEWKAAKNSAFRDLITIFERME